jgi:hypothetical protein
MAVATGLGGSDDGDFVSGAQRGAGTSLVFLEGGLIVD